MTSSEPSSVTKYQDDCSSKEVHPLKMEKSPNSSLQIGTIEMQQELQQRQPKNEADTMSSIDLEQLLGIDGAKAALDGRKRKVVQAGNKANSVLHRRLHTTNTTTLDSIDQLATSLPTVSPPTNTAHSSLTYQKRKMKHHRRTITLSGSESMYFHNINTDSSNEDPDSSSSRTSIQIYDFRPDQA